MNLGGDILYVMIVGCEAAFWVTLFAGLACRYLLRWRRVSFCLLLGVPLIDLFLLAFTVLDLRNGAAATYAHGLATAYVGFTIAFGSIIIKWADERFAYRFGQGPPPSKPPTRGWASVVYELKLWVRCILGVCITNLLLLAMIRFVDQPGRTEALDIWFRISFGTAVLWFVFGPVWSLVFFKRELKN